MQTCTFTCVQYMPCFVNYNYGIMPFTKRLCVGFKNLKIKTSVKRNNYSKKEIKICRWIYQWCDAVCIIRGYYCLNRDVIGERECMLTRNLPFFPGAKYKKNAFDLQTWNVKGQSQTQGSQWIVLIKVYLHVTFERVIVNRFPTMDPKAVAEPNCWRTRTVGQTDGHHHFIDRFCFAFLPK